MKAPRNVRYGFSPFPLLSILLVACGGGGEKKQNNDPRLLGNVPQDELTALCARLSPADVAYRTALSTPTCSNYGLNERQSGGDCEEARQECLDKTVVMPDSGFKFACDSGCTASVSEVEACLASYESETRRLDGFTCKTSRERIMDALASGVLWPDACDLLIEECPLD